TSLFANHKQLNAPPQLNVPFVFPNPSLSSVINIPPSPWLREVGLSEAVKGPVIAVKMGAEAWSALREGEPTGSWGLKSSSSTSLGNTFGSSEIRSCKILMKFE